LEIEKTTLSAEELGKLCTKRQRDFVQELDLDGNGTKAALRAGYGNGKEAAAAVAASRLLRNDKVSAYRRARALEKYTALGVDRETIAERLHGVFLRCMQAEPVMMWDSDAKAWVPSGEWKFDSKGALKALELIGQTIGMYETKVAASVGGQTVEEFLRAIEGGRKY